MHVFVKPVTLSLNQVRLEPLTLDHTEGLCKAVQDGELWQYRFTSAPTPDSVVDYIQNALDTRIAFAVIDEMTGKVVGTTSFYDINPAVPRLEIGHTWYSQSVWRSRINTTCKYLMMCHAFDTLGCNTVGWQTDILNERSQKVIERLGAKKNGVLRGYIVRKDGTIRDSVMYSMLVSEWQSAKVALEQKLFGDDIRILQMTIQIRPFAEQDHTQWRLLWEGYKAFYKVKLGEKVDQLTWQRILENKQIQGLGAFVNGKLAGIAHLVIHPGTWALKDLCYLEDLFVSPDFRKQGIAHQLIEHIYRLAEQNGYDRVYWTTAETNFIAQRVYNKIARKTEFIQYRKDFS